LAFLTRAGGFPSAVPAKADLFSGKIDPAQVQKLKALYAHQMSPAAPSPLDAVQPEPIAVASLLTLYLGMLPHPIIPPKFYYTFIKISCKSKTRERMGSGCI
jgi:hypothetical protein